MNGTAVSSEPISATKNAPLMPRWTSGKPSASTTRYRRTASVAQISPVSERQSAGSVACRPREDAFLESVVQLEDPLAAAAGG